MFVEKIDDKNVGHLDSIIPLKSFKMQTQSFEDIIRLAGLMGVS